MAETVATYLVECYLPGVTRADVAAAADRARAAAAAMAHYGRHVTYLGATLVEVDEAVFHAFEASDADLVREVSRVADLDFERVVESVKVPSHPAAGTAEVGAEA